jgi:protein-S-isoprenylcysteine O-methyltransferase Ste14
METQMSETQFFQLLFVLAIVPVVVIAGIHRHRARKAGQQSGDKLTRKEEGLWLLLPLRIGGMAIWLSFLAYAINPAWMSWSEIVLPAWLRIAAAVVVIVLVQPLVLWTYRAIGNNVTDTVDTRKNHQLITRGPYRWVRHPLYSIGFTAFLMFGLIAANAFMLIGALLAIILIVMRLPREEAQLVMRFGDDYQDYIKRTGTFLPRLG